MTTATQRKVKMEILDIPIYHRFQRMFLDESTGKLFSAGNGKGLKRGYLYYLSDKLTNQDKQELLDQYNNIMFFISRSEYAPEQIKTCIFVAERVLSTQTQSGGEK